MENPNVKKSFSVETVRALVRPYISIVMITTIAYLGIIRAIEAKDILYLGSIIVAFHFGEKSALKQPSGKPPA